MKTRKPPTCKICGQNEAIWAMQYIGEETPTFSSLGWHYRGFPVTKVCDICKELEEIGARVEQEQS